MTDSHYTAFEGHRLLAAGALADVARAVKSATDSAAHRPVLMFRDATGEIVDLDLRGSAEDVVARLPARTASAGAQDAPRSPGRPKLGVVSREVTLLPRHWEWLGTQQRSASVTLRRLIDDARLNDEASRIRAQQTTVYRVMSALAGDFPGFEEASRALFAADRERFKAQISSWPSDVRSYLLALYAMPERAAQPQQHVGDPVRYLDPTQASGRALVIRDIRGPIVMLNLLRFRAIADYSSTPELAPATPISGAEAYERYVAHTAPYLTQSGGEVLFSGDGGSFLIGPDAERWDRAMLVRQRSIESFMAFASDADYLAGMGHRTAALEDSRLLPLVETPFR